MIKENISQIRKRIALVCQRIERDPESLTIVAISKMRSVKDILSAKEAGITDIGENRVQEALGKYKEIGALRLDMPLRWHLVGRLQTNKVKYAVKIFDLIHSVDSLRLAQEIDKEAKRIDKVQDILVEVKTSPEMTKSGINPEGMPQFIRSIGEFKNIKTLGLMTIAPLVSIPEEARKYFKALKQLKDKINALRITDNTLHILSMGMTDDFEVAIEEGSNMVRLGRALFGDQSGD